MKKFEVGIEAKIIAVIDVEAENENEAIAAAKEELYADGYEVVEFTATIENAD